MVFHTHIFQHEFLFKKEHFSMNCSCIIKFPKIIQYSVHVKVSFLKNSLMTPTHSQKWCPSDIKITHTHTPCTGVLIHPGVKWKVLCFRSVAGKDDCCFLRRKMKTSQEKGRLKLPKMKSKMKKAGKITFGLGFHDMDPRRQLAALGCLQRLNPGHQGWVSHGQVGGDRNGPPGGCLATTARGRAHDQLFPATTGTTLWSQLT